MNPLEQRAVAPYHLDLMGLNALDRAADVWPALVQTGRSLTADDVCRLLGVGAWRSVVMGAWFSTGFRAEEVGAPLRTAMRRCAGSLTAPPLAVACVLVVGQPAADDLRHFLGTPQTDDDPCVRAALRHLTRHDLPETPDPPDDGSFVRLLDVGRRLGAALRG